MQETWNLSHLLNMQLVQENDSHVFEHLHSTGTTVLDSDLQKWILDVMGSFQKGQNYFLSSKSTIYQIYVDDLGWKIFILTLEFHDF